MARLRQVSRLIGSQAELSLAAQRRDHRYKHLLLSAKPLPPRPQDAPRRATAAATLGWDEDEGPLLELQLSLKEQTEHHATSSSSADAAVLVLDLRRSCAFAELRLGTLT